MTNPHTPGASTGNGSAPAAATTPRGLTRPRILCVDDDERLLAGLELRLRRGFDVVSATSAADALARLDLAAPFAVVISDMRMPNVDGATFLSAIRQVAPETVRILLTGQLDLASAISAVNDGEVFRILLKPIDAAQLIPVLEQAVARHRACLSDRQVPEAMLHGTIDLLTMSLHTLAPALASHASRIHALVKDMASVVCPRLLSVAELASVLLEQSLADVPPALIDRWRVRGPLSDDERRRVAGAIRRLLPVVRQVPHAEMLSDGLVAMATTTEHDTTHRVSIAAPVPFRVLHLALVFDAMERCGWNADDALQELRSAAHPDDAPLIAALASAPSRLDPGASRGPLWRIKPGQRVLYDVRHANGVLLLPKGHVVDGGTLEMLDLLDEGTRHLEVITTATAVQPNG